MALRDLALSKSGDLLINESGDFTIIDSVRQGIQIKLRWIKGEWVFNPEMGVPYFESILVKTPNRALIEKTLRDQILSVPYKCRFNKPCNGQEKTNSLCKVYRKNNGGGGGK